jgi:hypothetical protein
MLVAQDATDVDLLMAPHHGSLSSKAELLVKNYPQEMYGVSFTRGVTEGGSSGSGLFTLSGGSQVVDQLKQLFVK